MNEPLGNLSWYRGDTYPVAITLKVHNVPVDFTGYTSVTFCVNSEIDPEDATNELFKSVGVFDTDRTTGKITFSFTETQADNVGIFYFDIQGVDTTGKIRTFIKGNTIEFTQDINKD